MALVVAPARDVQSRHGLEAFEQRPADQPHALPEHRPAGEGEQSPAGALEVGAVGGGPGLLARRELVPLGEMVRDRREQIRRQGAPQGFELVRRDAPAVVEGTAQGDDGQTEARGLGLAVARGLACHAVEGVGEACRFPLEAVFQLADGGERCQGFPGGQGSQRPEGERGDAQQKELPGGLQAGPPPSSSRRFMK